MFIWLFKVRELFYSYLKFSLDLTQYPIHFGCRCLFAVYWQCTNTANRYCVVLFLASWYQLAFNCRNTTWKSQRRTWTLSREGFFLCSTPSSCLPSRACTVSTLQNCFCDSISVFLAFSQNAVGCNVKLISFVCFLCRHMRLELLEGVVAYHNGQFDKSRKALTSAQAKFSQVTLIIVQSS